MAKFKLSTAFQFPFLKYNELVSYSEVKKPNGVAYMLLVLINESKGNNAPISTVLENLGVPKAFHDLFANQLEELCYKGIITTENGISYTPSKFSTYSVSHLKFTDYGKKIFAEESIPTGVTKESKIPVFYNVATKQLMIAIPGELEPKPLVNSAMPQEYVLSFNCEKNIEDFINISKGQAFPIYENNKLIKREIIKKEEIITSVVEQSKEAWSGKYDCNLILEDDRVSFEFEDKVIENFFNSKYMAKIINKSFEYKPRFSFSSNYQTNLHISSYSKKDIINILIPKDMDGVLKLKSKLLLTKGNYKSEKTMCIDDLGGLSSFDDAVEFMVVDQANNIFAYVPGVFDFYSDTLGDISIPLVLKLRVSLSELNTSLKPHLASLGNYSEESFKKLVDITMITKDYAIASSIMYGYLDSSPESNIIRLNEMKPYAIKDSSINAIYKTLLNDNYREYMKSVEEDNLQTVLRVTKSIPQTLNISNVEAVSMLFSNLKGISDPLDVYEECVSNGLDRRYVVTYVNPIPQLLEGRATNDKYLSSFVNYNNCVSTMKKLTGIFDPVRYTFDEEKLDKIKFQQSYLTAKGLEKDIEFLGESNKELFGTYSQYMSIFGKINDDINIQKAALSNPNNIKPDLIEKKITSGDYQFVFVNLSAKLELILKNEYKIAGKLSAQISEAHRRKVMSHELASDLHEFRENRNAYIHPEGREALFNADDLRRWSKEIFELEDEKK